MARPTLTKEQRAEIRSRIRKAAAELYAKSGLSDISARGIAKRAGVSVGTIYSYFDNLPELMQSLWIEPVRHLVKELNGINEEMSDPEQRLRKLLTTYVNFARDNSAVYRGAFMFVRPETHNPLNVVPFTDAGIAKAFLTAVVDGQASGHFRDGDPERLTELLWAGVHGAIALPVNLDRIEFSGTDDLAERMIDQMMVFISTQTG